MRLDPTTLWLLPLLLLVVRPTESLVSYDTETGRRYLIWALCIGATNPQQCVNVEFEGQILLAIFEADCSDLIFKGLCRVVVDIDESYTLLGITFKAETGIVNITNNAGTILDAQALVAFGTYGKVMTDLLTAFGRLWNNGLGAYMASMWEQYCDLYISFSGYSLGSCLAQMAAVRFYWEQWWPADQMFYFGFGTPRCGNEDFANYVDQSVVDKFRVDWINDPFPTHPATTCSEGSAAALNQCVNGYFHCCKAYRYSTYTSALVNAYAECSGTGCIPSVSTNSDHYSYFGTNAASVDSLTCTTTMNFP